MTAPEPFGESSEVSWPLGTTVVHGTVVRPSGPGPFPGVVLVAGSGPTDRDWNSPLLPGPNGSGRLVAEMLGRAGIASLRNDKRASGPHVSETIPQLIGRITMQSHVDELAGAVRTLAAEGWVRGDRIFALGNSEGTLHALNYQLEKSAPPPGRAHPHRPARPRRWYRRPIPARGPGGGNPQRRAAPRPLRRGRRPVPGR